jgi:uncharacterized caspase-like protein
VRARALAVGLLAALAGAPALHAQSTHLLVITGLGGAPEFQKLFNETAGQLADSARARWKVADSSLIVLGEDPVLDPRHIMARSTKEEVAAAFLRLSRRVKPGDVVLVFLNGHGGGEGPASRVNLPGPDPTAADYASWLSGFSQQSVVFVNAATASGDFLPVLKGAGRVIITATKTAIEKNESVFAAPFVRGLATGEADADKDGRVSVLEAFTYAQKEVVRSYEAGHKLLTEHAQISDSVLARTIAFGGARTSDPRVIALVSQRQALESQVAILRGKKAAMDSSAYTTELERLLLAIAEKSQAIRAAGGTP